MRRSTMVGFYERDEQRHGHGFHVKRLVIRILKLILFVPAGLYEILLLVLVGFLLPFIRFKSTKKSSKHIASTIFKHAHRLPNFDWYFH